MPKSLKISLLALSVVFVLCLFLGVNARGVAAAGDTGQDGAYRQINVYGEVLQHVQTDYVEDPNIPKVTTGALHGLLESLDADSSYLNAADYKVFKEHKGGKAQVGINVSKRYGYATVVSVVPGSPADKANLNDGDIIEAIGNQDTRDLSLAVIQLMLQGVPGTELQLAVIRPRQAVPEKISLNRVVVSEPAVSDTLYENSSILYLRPYVLDHEHVAQMEAKLKGLGKGTTKKVLLDLRDVSAGEEAEAVRAANFFLQTGTIATLQGQKVAKQTFTAESSKTLNAGAPLVVLVNRGTAGPAELVAAALADNKRGDLVGEKTFGAGTQQKTFELADGSAIILSVAKYASPGGKKFEDEAVTPATLVASNVDTAADDDNDANKTAEEKAAAAKKSSTQPDDQLSKALEMLKAKAA
ncbi:MAG TPA: S41 family peptidase [Acidobacteriaceae bacterium]|jgi:carboxyl-terminal processing protease|nr:S41 family peptidase [Acidobacteriaceae bacterium]